MSFGLIGGLNPAGRYGRVVAADGANYPFLFSDCESGHAETIRKWQPVEFELAPHPWETGRQVAKRVRVVAKLPVHRGRVTLLRGSYGFLRIEAGDGVFFLTQAAPALATGDAVVCTAVPGRDNHLFALTVSRVEPTPAGSVVAERPDMGHGHRGQPARGGSPGGAKAAAPGLAAATRIGSRHGKDVNDDAFLVHPILGGEACLLAVADGISRPANGWWASDKCMELIWRSLPDVEQRLAQGKGQEQQIISEWLDRLNRDFLRERSSQPSEFQQSSSTLTLAVARGHAVCWAHCGDTRLYVVDPGKAPQFRLIGAFSDSLDTQRAGTGHNRTGLSSHIAAKGADWNPLSDHLVIPKGGLLLLCSDGVVAGERELKRAKSAELKKLLGAGGSLQSAVEAALRTIQAAGEGDDLTLVAFRPTE